MSRSRILSRDLDELICALPEERPMLPAKAVGKYVSNKLAEGDVDAASLGLEQILSAYSAPLPPATVSRLGLMRDQVLDLRRSGSEPTGEVSEPRGMLVPAIYRNPRDEEGAEWYEQRQRVARSRGRAASPGAIDRTRSSISSTFTTTSPPAPAPPVPRPDFRFLPAPGRGVPESAFASEAPAGGESGKWLLLGALGLGIGFAGWSEGWMKKR
jgi:hypothetical protein